jgi:hypothetical protein
MAYHRHNPENPLGDHPGYNGTDYEMHQEADDDIKYQDNKYQKKDDPISGVYSLERERQQKESEKSEFEKQLEDEHKPKYEKGKTDVETIKRKAAEEINREMVMLDSKAPEKKKKTASSIEEAIEKAVKEEKKVLILNR